MTMQDDREEILRRLAAGGEGGGVDSAGADAAARTADADSAAARAGSVTNSAAAADSAASAEASADAEAAAEERAAADIASLPPPPLPAAAGGDLVQMFAAAARECQSEVRIIDDIAALPQTAAAYLREKGAPPQALCEQKFLALPWQEAGIAIASRAPLKEDSCGVTGVVAAAADSAALLLTDSVPHRLTLSLTPPYHIAVVPAAAIYPDLPALWQQLPQPLPRGSVLACGPSRTADIEQTLTLGAHGPVGVLAVVVTGGGALAAVREGQPII